MLATGYEWQDPTHLIVHIRDGVQFQDGEKLNADAVKYKLTRDRCAGKVVSCVCAGKLVS
jgi:ABC-type transport system substrate-binding protein